MSIKKRLERLEQQNKADDWQPKPLSWFYGEREELPPKDGPVTLKEFWRRNEDRPKNRPLTLDDFYGRKDDDEPDGKCKLY